MRWYLIFGVLFILLSCPVASFSETLPVKEIRVVGLNLISKEEFLDVLGLRPGEAFTREAISLGIKRLFHKGIFEDITIDYDDGVITCIVKERRIIKKIVFKGNLHVSDDSLKEALPYKYGDLFRARVREELLKALKERLAELGFPGAKISIDTIEDPPPFVTLVCHIYEGQPAIISSIKIDVVPEVRGIEPWQLRSMMRTTPGEVFDSKTIKADIERLRAYMRHKGYLLVHIDRPSLKDGIVNITIHPGIRYAIGFSGNRAFSEREIKEGAGFDRLRLYNQEEFEAMAYRIKRFYKKNGYLEASVKLSITYTPLETKVVYRITEGSLYKVERVQIKGGKVPSQTILKRLYLRNGTPFNPDMIKRDISTIESIYRSLGYRDVKVTYKVEVSDSRRVFIDYEVAPGQVYRILYIRTRGNRAFSSEDLLQVFKVKAGDIYNRVDLEEGRRAVQRFYRSKGFLDAKVTLRTGFHDHRVSVVLEINEGLRYVFGKTIVMGNIQTDYSVIKRKVPFKEGEFVNPELLPEMIRGLYATGLFSDVTARFIDGGRGIKDLLVKVEEAPPGTVEFSLGYGEYEKLRGAFEVRYLNLFGKNRTGSFRMEMNTLRTTLQVAYRDPYLIEPDVEFLGRVRFEREDVKNFDTGQLNYRVKRYSATAGLQKPIARSLTGSISYGYSLVQTYDISPGIVLSEEDKGYLGIGSLTLAMTYDKRDNPFNPSKGFLMGVSLKNASSYLLGQTDFVKVTGSTSVYFRLLRPLVLAMGAKAGLARGYRKTDKLPIVERFFLGGRDSVRGFPQNSLGPKDQEGNPIGGNAFLQTNLELRLRVFDSLGLVGFVDGGNVWTTMAEMSSNLRYTAGLGLRYNTPAGPIRFDYGWKLDVRPGESAGEFHFSIGHVF